MSKNQDTLDYLDNVKLYQCFILPVLAGNRAMLSFCVFYYITLIWINSMLDIQLSQPNALIVNTCFNYF